MSYAEDAASAKADIAEAGRPMILRDRVQSGDDWNPTFDDVDVEIMGVMVEFSTFETGNNLVQADDKKVLIDGEFLPTTEMKLVDEGIEYEIVRVKPLKPGDTLIMSELHVRK